MQHRPEHRRELHSNPPHPSRAPPASAGYFHPITPLHLAFEAKSREEVEAFYDAALGAVGKGNGKPVYRTEYWPGYYAAFVCDPDGHNIEAVWYDYEKAV